MPPRQHTFAALMTLVAATTFLTNGCQYEPDLAPAPQASDAPIEQRATTGRPPPTTQVVTSLQQAEPTTRPIAVAEGPLPLTYIVSFDGVFRVIDLSRDMPLVDLTLRPGSVIVIDAELGVLVGRRQHARGPLSSARYAVQWVPDLPNESRQMRVGVPAPSGPDTEQPD